MVHDDLFLLIFRYLGISFRTKSFALYKRVQDMTTTDDEGDLAKLDPAFPLLHELRSVSPISISPVVFRDERRQHLVGMGWKRGEKGEFWCSCIFLS